MRWGWQERWRRSGGCWPAERTDVDSLIAAADQRMYAGKRARVPDRPASAVRR